MNQWNYVFGLVIIMYHIQLRLLNSSFTFHLFTILHPLLAGRHDRRTSICSKCMNHFHAQVTMKSTALVLPTTNTTVVQKNQRFTEELRTKTFLLNFFNKYIQRKLSRSTLEGAAVSWHRLAQLIFTTERGALRCSVLVFCRWCFY